MKILIINLTRMGDIIQTFPLINKLREKYPNSEIDYLCVKSFKTILNFCSHINKIYTIDADHFLNNSHDLINNYNEISAKIDELNKENYDILINPIISKQSALLGKLVRAKEKFGMFYNEMKEHNLTSAWSSYHLANEHNLGDKTLNIVDIFAGIGKVKTTYEDFKIDVPSLSPSTNELIEKFKNHKTVGFHIGASQENKTWEKEKFYKVIKNLLDHTDYKIVLFGGYKEKSYLDYFSFESSNFLNLIDQTNIEELIKIISKINLFITNDTGPMHIAAALKIPIINISLGPVSLWETGPYSNNVVIIQANIKCHPCKFTHICDHLNCHKQIKPNNILNLIQHFFNKEELKHDPEVFIWKSILDQAKFQFYVPIKKREINKKELFFEFKRLIWIQTLKNKLEPSNLAEYLNFLSQYYEIDDFDFSEEIIFLEKIKEKSREQLQLFDVDKKTIDNLKQKWTLIKNLKEEISLNIKNDMNSLYDLVLFSIFQESSLDNTDIKTLWASTQKIYEIFNKQITMLIFSLRRFYENIN